MKSQIKLKIVFLITFGIVFSLLINIRFIEKNSEFYDEISFNNRNVEISTIPGGIKIIGNSGWIDYKNAGIVSGFGNLTHPYVIEDLVINANNTIFGIWIQNSTVYFKIQNCSIFNSRLSDGNPLDEVGAIKLNNVTNGLLIDNNISSNDRGIFIESSSNITISGNELSENGAGGYTFCSYCGEGHFSDYYGAGIELTSSNNINIMGNVAYNNSFGIWLEYGNNNNITGNLIYNNIFGIRVNGGNNTFIEENNIDKSVAGITVSRNINTTISKNIMLRSGLRFSDDLDVEYEFPIIEPIQEEDDTSTNKIKMLTSYNIDNSNLVNGKPLYYYTNEANLGSSNFTNAGQVILVNCSDSSISNLNISYGSTGISLLYSNNNNITGNSVINHKYEGISLLYSNDNNISGNFAINNTRILYNFSVGGDLYDRYNGIGIKLNSSNNNHISGNYVNDNGGNGMDLWLSDNNKISGNIVNNNTEYGISLSFSDTNKISGNFVNNNYWSGIKLINSNNINISRNFVNNNYRSGIELINSYFNYIIGNTITNNYNGIDLFRSDGNLIVGNNLTGNYDCITEGFCKWNIIEGNNCTRLPRSPSPSPSFSLVPITLIISSAILGISGFIIFKNHKKLKRPQEDLDFL
jgi:parallel beta-helix repeat protein